MKCSVEELSSHAGQLVTVNGWVYNIRQSKGILFIEFRDGSGICQSVLVREDAGEEVWQAGESLRQESSLEITGKVVRDDRSEGGYEIHITSLSPIQNPESYPIALKEHGVDFLMENRHLWLRSRRQWAAMRVRNRIIHAIHGFFQGEGFIQMDAPVFTANAAEGTTTLFETDYFDEKAYLTQSGQLYAEAMAMAHGKVYTFGPTFRAEKSKTRRHLTEFWMVEPEMAFYDLEMNMDLAEGLVKQVLSDVLEKCGKELMILERDEEPLRRATEAPFQRLSYDEAAELLRGNSTRELLDRLESEARKEMEDLHEEEIDLKKEHGSAKKWRKTQIDQRLREVLKRRDLREEELRNIPEWRKSAESFVWGEDFGGSDETLLTLQFDVPLIIHRYPAEIKAFYMKRDPKCERLALAMDVLAPEGYGEVIGGSQREDDEKLLLKRLEEHGLPKERFEWYLDLRRYGSVPHSGFGLGIERTVAWICGLSHVRETIPFPRMLGRLTP